ncbi:site-specific integrase [Anderseniella sp. Alg231-50]|uniref:site-specific integrase n=1 Tax=Anderseniella sp. Alg231-50 TaxID=1922226 RepID=UPI00307C174E
MNQLPSEGFTLQHVVAALTTRTDLSATRRRDFVAAVKWVANALDQSPNDVPIDLRKVTDLFRRASGLRAGLSGKRLQNLKSDFGGAVNASGLATMLQTANLPLSDAWNKQLKLVSDKPTRTGLSRFSRFCTGLNIEPAEVIDEVFAEFKQALEKQSMVTNPQTSWVWAVRSWNKACKIDGWNGNAVTPVRVGREPVRMPTHLLPDSFWIDLEEYLTWCSVTSPFDEKSRRTALKPATIHLRRQQIKSAVEAALKVGIEPEEIKSIHDLVECQVVKAVFRHLYEVHEGKPNAYTSGVATTLVTVAKEWVRVSADQLTELKALRSKLPSLSSGLTEKNKATLLGLKDPAALAVLLGTPETFWMQARGKRTPSKRRLPHAQIALLIELLLACPMRMANAAALEFGRHISFPAGPKGRAYLCIPGDETKNGLAIEAELPVRLSEMLKEYRDVLVPAVCGRKHFGLFIDRQGRKKITSGISVQFKTAMRQSGLNITPHQMRHIAAWLILNDDPGAIYQVSQLLGHKNIKTTQKYYAGIDTNRAVNHMSQLIEKVRGDILVDGNPAVSGSR